MATKKAYKNFRGVYYTESKVKKWRERPDRCMWIAFRDPETKKLKWERCGWASEGWTPEKAQQKRYTILNDVRTGAYVPRAKRKQLRLSFAELMEKHYLPWADSNKKSARTDRLRYKKWLKDSIGRKDLKNICNLDLERIRKSMKEAGKAPGTIKQAFCLVRQAFNKASEWGLYDGENPASKIKMPSTRSNRRNRFLTFSEARMLLDELSRVSRQTHDEAMLSLYCGLRFGEIANLRWGDIDFSNELIHIKDTKSGENRHAYMTPAVREMLSSRMSENTRPADLVFPGRNGKLKDRVSPSFFRAVARLGLNDGISDPRDKVVFHTLRHTFASWLAKQGTPLCTIKELLGHRTLAMTERYAHLIPDQKITAIKSLAKTFEESSKSEAARILELKPTAR